MKQGVLIILISVFISSGSAFTFEKECIPAIKSTEKNSLTSVSSLNEDELLFTGGFEKSFNSADSTFAEFQNAPSNFVNGGSGKRTSLIKHSGKYSGVHSL